MKKFDTKFVRYVVVGISTMVLDYLAFSAIFFLLGNYILAENLKLPIILGFNYIAHRVFTFKSEKKIKVEVAKYIATNILILILSNLLLILLVSVIIDVQIAKLVQLILMPLITYTLLNRLVYSTRISN